MSDSEEAKTQLLLSIPFFKDLEESSLKSIAGTMTVINFEKGHVIIKEGELSEELYLISEGEADVRKSDKAHSHDIRLLTLRRGDFIGLGTLLEKTPHSATVTASSLISGYKITFEAFNQLLTTLPGVGVLLAKYLTKELRVFRMRLASAYELTNQEDPEGFSVIKMVVYDFKMYEKKYFDAAISQINEEIKDEKIKIVAKFFEVKLNIDTVPLSQGAKIACIFVNDNADAAVIEKFHELGVSMIALRCAGFNNVDLQKCQELKISVARVPAYSPYAVAEHCVALLMTLNRKIHQAYNRVKTGNFSLGSLVGIDVHGRTVGVIGTGKIGACFVRIMKGFGANVLCYDVYRNAEVEKMANVKYTDTVEELLKSSEIVSIHVPLTAENKHMICKDTIAMMPKGSIIINTSRGALINTTDLIAALKSGHVGGAGLDVYEGESEYFFEDKSAEVIKDDTLARLMMFNNVIVTSHQAFLTGEALSAIANVTLANVKEFTSGKKVMKELTNSVNLN
ncbi:hypothetical protein HK098_005230 [Nowakowskiella sp. JEL0407]|nr:hypothetical protein HK098_005230 [Nowakowskiella sp. JEL0407]